MYLQLDSNVELFALRAITVMPSPVKIVKHISHNQNLKKDERTVLGMLLAQLNRD